MLPFAPGNSPQFQVTPSPSDVPLNPLSSMWSASGAVQDDALTVAPAGDVVTVAIPATAVVGTEFTLTWVYTNADGSQASASFVGTIVAATEPVPNIVSGVIAQIA